MLTRRIEPLQSAVTDQQIADFLALDELSPVASLFTLSATGYVVDYLQRELVTRKREVIYQDWPFIGAASSGMSGSCIRYLSRIELPYAAPLFAVDSVEIYGEAQQYTLAVGSTPAQLCFDQVIPRATGCAEPAIRAVYDAGYGAIDDVPSEIQTAILMMAAFLFEHRGQCDVGDPMGKSGAAALLQPYRVRAVAL